MRITKENLQKLIAEESEILLKGLIREETDNVLTEAMNAETKEIVKALARIGYKVKLHVEVDGAEGKQPTTFFEKPLHPGVGWISQLDVKQKSIRDPKRRKKKAPQHIPSTVSAISDSDE